MSPVDDLPVGTVTFLFTDIEGSTRLLKQLRERYGEALEEHQRILRQAFAAFTKGEVAKSNGLPKEKDHLAWHWEETIEMSLDLMVYRQHA